MPRTRLPLDHPSRACGTPADLAYFPEHQADEHLFSLVSRFARHSGQTGFKARELMFGDPDYRMRLDAPTSLSRFSSMFGDTALADPSYVLEHLTPFNFMTSYMSEEARARIVARMMAAADTRNATKPIGEWNSSASRPMRFCASCHEDDIANPLLRERYWRRLHQLQGVAVCIKHAEVLRLSTVRGGIDTVGCDRPPNAANCSAAAMTIIGVDPNGLAMLMELAKRAAALLASPRPPETADDRAYRYRQRAAEIGLTSHKGVSTEAAAISFSETWGSALSAMPETLASDGFPSWWLQRMFHTYRGPHPIEHPLPHMLVEIWLERATALAQDDERVAALRRDRLESAGRGRKDGWRTRREDAELADKVAEAANEIRRRVPEKRVTLAEMSRTLGRRAVASPKALKHWPLTRSAIEIELETPDQFLKRQVFRRMDHAAAEGRQTTVREIVGRLRPNHPSAEMDKLHREYVEAKGQGAPS